MEVQERAQLVNELLERIGETVGQRRRCRRSSASPSSARA
jgi:hypothetical protein